MKTFLLERGGKFSSVPLKTIIEQITPSCAVNLLDLMGEHRKVPLQFTEEPFYGFLRHNEELYPSDDVTGVVPGVFCVELVWTIPFETTVQVRASSADEAANRAVSAMYEHGDRVYDEMTEAFYAFEPKLECADILDAMPVYKRAYAEISQSLINPEDKK